MTSRNASTVLFVFLLSALALAPSASAFKVVSEAGKGAGQTRGPNGLAVDFETGRLYVADTENNRVDVFDAAGGFLKAFGWGVKTGANQFEVCTTKCQEGIAGDGKGQFNHPRAIAIDNDPLSASQHAVYVADTGNNRIEKFDAEGNFILTFGGGVNKTTPGNVCTAVSGDVCGKGSTGFAEGEFSATGSRGILVGVGPAGTIYVVDSSTASGGKYRLQKFEPSGALISPQHILFEAGTAWGLAVASSGEFYVSDGTATRKYKADASLPPIYAITEPFEEARDTLTLAIDANDHFFAASSGFGGSSISIMQFDPAGNPQRRFGYGSTARFFDALAPYSSASGDIYAGEGSSNLNETIGYRVLHLDFPDAGPLVLPQPCEASPIRPAKATLRAEVNPEGKATTFHFEYITEAAYQANLGDAKEGFFGATSTPESASIGSDFTLHKASAEADVEPETEYRCRVVATNADAPGGNEGPEGGFETPKAPEILDVWTTEVKTQTATLNAEVDPLGIATTGYFEYVDEATFQVSGFDDAQKTPEIDFGDVEIPVLGSSEIAGLEPGTTYRYRLAATDTLIEPQELFSEVKTFRTFASSGGLADSRGYELVSPGQKNSAEVAIPSVAGGLFANERPLRINAAATSGEAVTYTSWNSFGDPEGAPSASQYLSKRGPSGWGTENISPFGFMQDPLELPYRGFTPDLGFGAFAMSEPALTPEAQDGFENLYLRDNETGELQALTIQTPVPGAGESFCTGYAGVSADGQHAFFAAKGAMAGAPVGKGFSLYEWSGAGGGSQLNLVSVLPDGSPAPPIKDSESPAPGNGSGFGAVGGNCTMGQAFAYHAVSEDGSIAFWSYAGEYEGAKEPLLARVDGSETIQLDAKPAVNPGTGPYGGGRFWTANATGSKVIFSAPGRLVKGTKNNSLYRYDTDARTLTALIPTADPEEIQGVIGTSEDGAYVYFVAAGVLTGEEENAAGQKAEEGANNLYLYHDGEGVRFIAGLSDVDGGVWETIPYKRTARVSPDGRHLAFLTIEAKTLSGFDSRIAPPGEHCQPILENKLEGDPRCAQAYLYDADADSLTCASCNPAGSRPAGPTELPVWSNPYEGPRYLSEDGSRLFFESRDALSAADQNGRRDVYQFELAGAGSCSSASPEFVLASGGCLSLISSGESGDESYLVDASASGRDAFFSTREPLTGWDENENYDVYDAREGGGFPEPAAPPSICEGEACKPPPLAPPAAAAPATSTFVGPGNPKAKQQKGKKHKPKGKKHKGKKKRHKAKKHRTGRANHQRSGR